MNESPRKVIIGKGVDNPIVANLLSGQAVGGQIPASVGPAMGTVGASSSGPRRIMLRDRRWILLAAGLTIILGILTLHPNRPVFPWYYVVIWIALAFWVVRMCLRAHPVLVSPLLFCMYFLVGYPLKVVYGQLSARLFPMLSTGMYFARKSGSVDFEIVMAAAASIVGVGLGAKFVLRIRTERQSNKRPREPWSSGPVSRENLGIAVGALALLLPVLYVFMWKYHIGQTGVRAVVLPYRLAGMAVQIRDVFVPMMEVYLLWQCLKLRSRGLLWLMIGIIAFESLASGFLAMSRGTTLARLIVFGAFWAKIYRELPVRTNRRFLIGGFCLLALNIFAVAPSITAFREYRWRGRSLGSAAKAAFSAPFKGGNHETKVHFVFQRMLGIEDLMGVAAYRSKSWPLMYRAITSGRGMRFVNYNVFCLRKFADRQIGGRTFIGRGMSIIGYMYLSGSLLVVFGASLVICLLVCAAEIYFDRIALAASTVWVALCVPNLWEGMFRNLLYGLGVFFWGYWLLSRVIDPWLRRRWGQSKVIAKTQARLGRMPWGR